MRVLVAGDAASANVQQWCGALARAGADVALVSFANATKSAAPVHRVRLPGVLGPIRYYLGRSAARRTSRRFRPDVVVGYYATGYGTLARLIGRRPLVMVTAGNDVLLNPSGTLAHRAATRNLRTADLVLAWAPHLADAAVTFGVDRGRIIVRPRGVATAALRPDPDGDRTAIVSTRSLEPFYRHDLVVAALADPRLRHATLTLIGTGSVEHQLRALASRLGVERRVRFAGRLPAGELATIVVGHGVYASPSPSDGVSASLLEAMSAGLVPVVADIVASRQWIAHRDNGLLVEGDDPRAWADALVDAVTDDELRARALVSNPARIAAEADIDRNAALTLTDLERLIAGL